MAYPIIESGFPVSTVIATADTVATTAATISTTKGSSIVAVYISQGGASSVPISIAGGGLTWVLAGSWDGAPTAPQGHIRVWIADSSAALSSQAITVTRSDATIANRILTVYSVYNLRKSSQVVSGNSISFDDMASLGNRNPYSFTISGVSPNSLILGGIIFRGNSAKPTILSNTYVQATKNMDTFSDMYTFNMFPVAAPNAGNYTFGWNSGSQGGNWGGVLGIELLAAPDIAITPKPLTLPKLNFTHPLAKNLLVAAVPRAGELISKKYFGALPGNTTYGIGPFGLSILVTTASGLVQQGVNTSLSKNLYNFTGTDYSCFWSCYYTTMSDFGAVCSINNSGTADFNTTNFGIRNETSNALLIRTGTTNTVTSAANFFAENMVCYGGFSANSTGTDIYRNGTLFEHSASVLGAPSWNNTATLQLGSNLASSSAGRAQMVGYTDVFYFFNKKISAEEHALLAQNPSVLLDFGDNRESTQLWDFAPFPANFATPTIQSGSSFSSNSSEIFPNEILDFGTVGSNHATQVVTGQSGITATSVADAWIMGDASTTKTQNDHLYAALAIKVKCGNIVPGVGFTIYATSPYKLTGRYKIRWVWR